jgi:hypothetical protein
MVNTSFLVVLPENDIADLLYRQRREGDQQAPDHAFAMPVQDALSSGM